MVKFIDLKLIYKIFTVIFLISFGTINSSCQTQNTNSENKSFCKLLTRYSLNTDGKSIIIDKGSRQLTMLENGKKKKSFEITIGEEAGNKTKSGDNRTPEGVFLVQKIHNSSSWIYFPEMDTTKPIVGAYGPWFVRLKVPGFQGIGIHGFYHDEDIGGRASRGCIRLNNKHLQEVVDFVEIGMPVLIIPGEDDIKVNKKELDL